MCLILGKLTHIGRPSRGRSNLSEPWTAPQKPPRPRSSQSPLARSSDQTPPQFTGLPNGATVARRPRSAPAPPLAILAAAPGHRRFFGRLFAQGAMAPGPGRHPSRRGAPLGPTPPTGREETTVWRLKPRLQKPSPPSRTDEKPEAHEPAQAGFVCLAATSVAKATSEWTFKANWNKKNERSHHPRRTEVGALGAKSVRN